MSYCLQPTCKQLQNPEDAIACLDCGSKLLLQRYRVLKLIGEGGFGKTFLAVDESHPLKLCCVKQFFPQNKSNHQQQMAVQFRQEALRLEALGKHPQIPELLGYFEQNGQQYLVQEFIYGQNLAQELAEEGAFNETQIRKLLSDLLPVLQFVHEHQIIHRDIKPANIIRRQGDHQLVLVDFGAAKSVPGTALAETGTVIGSAEYAAPEQIRGKAAFASDLYSLGVTCIHLLTQIPPFDLFDSSEDSWVWRDYLLSSPVSASLGRILDKLLQNATKRRYQSAAAVLKDLMPTRVILKSLATAEAITQEDFESPYFGISCCKIPLKSVAVKSTASFLPVTSLSATVFDPQTQTWYRVPDDLNSVHSEILWAIASFLRPRLAAADSSHNISHNIFPATPIATQQQKKRHWWFLTALVAVVITSLTLGIKLQPPANSSQVKYYSILIQENV